MSIGGMSLNPLGLLQSGGSFLGIPSLFGKPASQQPEFNATPYLQNAGTDIGNLSNWLNSAGPGGSDLASYIAGMATPGSPQETANWNLLSSRYINSLMPQYAHAGLATSGPGMTAMTQGMQDLSTQYNKSLQDQMLQAASEATNIKALPADLWASLFSKAAVPQLVNPGATGMLQNLGGGSGVSSLLGNSGTSTSAGSGLAQFFG